jgi:hypothetical protein
MDFFNFPNPYSHIMTLGFTQKLSWGGKWRPARKADNLTAIWVPIV